MSYPHFIAIDPSSYEEEANPIAIAWSMSDGQIKTTLIQPDDGWDDWDYALEDIHGISRDTLYQRGETAWAVVRELEADLDQSRVYSDDAETSEGLLEKIYEACNRDQTLEVVPFPDALDDHSNTEELNDQLYHQHLTCDDRVLVMLTEWARQNGQQEPTYTPNDYEEE